MFADPTEIVISDDAVSLPRVSVGDHTATYKSGDGNITLTISHANGRRERSVVRVDRKSIGADPLQTGVNRPYSMSAYLVVDRPPVGFSDEDAGEDIKALCAFMSDAGNLSKFLGQES